MCLEYVEIAAAVRRGDFGPRVSQTQGDRMQQDASRRHSEKMGGKRVGHNILRWDELSRSRRWMLKRLLHERQSDTGEMTQVTQISKNASWGPRHKIWPFNQLRAISGQGSNR